MKPDRIPPSVAEYWRVVAAMSARHGLLLLLALTMSAYANSFAGVWQFDDYAVLLADPRVQTLSAWWQSLPHIRPLFKFSVALMHETGAGLIGFHAVNLLLHLANTLLVFTLFRQLLPRALPTERATAAALIVSCVFALHPAQTEAVSYLSGRSVALEAFGLLLAACALLRWQASGQRRWLAAVMAGLIWALASRESAVIAPLLLLVIGQWQQPHSRRLWLALLASAALALAVVLVLPRYRELLWLALPWQGFGHLLAVQSQAVLHLLAVAIGVTAVNADPSLIVAPLGTATGVATLLGLALAVTLVWHLRRRRPLLTLAALWLLVIWLPSHSLLLRFDAVNDRQLYLALPALALVALDGWWWLTADLRLPGRVAPLLTLLVASVLTLATVERNRVYHSELAFWQDVLAKSPHNARGWNNAGFARAEQGDRPGAEAAFARALQLQPDYRKAAVNLRLLQAGKLAPNAAPTR